LKLFAQPDQHGLAFNFNVVCPRVLRGGHRQGLASADIETSPVPWADDLAAVQSPLPQWASVVFADVLDAVKLAANVQQHDALAGHLNRDLTRVRHMGHLGDGNEFRHMDVGYAQRTNPWGAGTLRVPYKSIRTPESAGLPPRPTRCLRFRSESGLTPVGR